MKAFVGHSFADKDEALVNKIITFLSQRAGVTCTSGEKPLNKSVSEKIKQWIDENEVFIGIFTEDREIFQEVSFFGRFTRKLPPAIYTTSNWVIQESGYALGRDKETIFVVEKGIYKFPELQGDKELIYFTRDEINDALLRLFGTIKELESGGPAKGGPAKTSSEGTPELTPDEEAKQESEKKKEGKKILPYSKMFKAHDKDDIPSAEKIYKEQIRDSLEDKDKHLWDAVILRWKYHAGDASALKSLESMAQELNNFEVLWQLGLCYDFADKKELIGTFEKCSELADNNSDKVKSSIKIAKFFSWSKDYESAIDKLLIISEKDYAVDQQEQILLALIDIAKDKDDDYLYLLFSEKLLDINPVNTSVRFNLAYKYGNIDKSEMAIYHYKKLLSVEDNAMGFNNMGVECSNLGLKAKGVYYYKKAIEKKNTLAHTNMAYKYLNEGLTDMADSLLQDADKLSQEGIKVHQNIGYAKNKLDNVLKEEEEKEKKILDDAKQLQQFKVKHADGYCKINNQGIKMLSGVWRIKDRWNVSFNINDSNNSFTGEYTEEYAVDQSLYRGLGGLFGTGLSQEQKTFRIRKVEIQGSMKNMSGNYSIKITEEPKDPRVTTTLTSATEVYAAKGMLVISEDGSTVDIFEEDSKKARLFSKWVKKISEK